MTDPRILDLAPGTADRLRLQRSSTSEQVADVLRDLILRGEIKPAAPMREMHLAPALGVSRNTMREALRILAREGMVVQDRHHVASAVEVSPADVCDIFAARLVVECGAVDLLRRSNTMPDLTPLAAACNRLASRDDGSWMEVIAADREFHVQLVHLAGNRRLDHLYAQMESEIRLCLTLTTKTDISLAQIEGDHRQLLDHLRQRDYDRVVASLTEVTNEARDRVVSILASWER
jgi:DNA-binding GntR family transcriptional regulator